jgi:hypothetical protein
MKIFNKIKSLFILSLFCLVLVISSSSVTQAQDPAYRAAVIIELAWADGYPSSPIAPRDEIAEFDLKITMNIKTGPTFGAGLLEGYLTENNPSATALIDLRIVDYPNWCSATLDKTLIMTNISRKEEAFCKLYIHVNEDAPAYEEGIIKFEVNISDLGLIKGDRQVFNLTFKPSYFPRIKTLLPQGNTKRINPTSEAEFPIEIQNKGNAETKVLMEIIDAPDAWAATVTDSIIIGEERNSKNMAYLTIRPSRDFGFHNREAVVSLKITPTFSENVNITGEPIFANFIVQTRGISSSGAEFYLPIVVIIVLIFLFLFMAVRKRYSKD